MPGYSRRECLHVLLVILIYPRSRPRPLLLAPVARAMATVLLHAIAYQVAYYTLEIVIYNKYDPGAVDLGNSFNNILPRYLTSVRMIQRC
ncbi:hypothetical protein GGR50DRAFT_647219 [Xylaria sp. CBS 124048]|nr:hypothetical protein GGR50DRAFT_647219 [Xylaria sp. CBS 124048]